MKKLNLTPELEIKVARFNGEDDVFNDMQKILREKAYKDIIALIRSRADLYRKDSEAFEKSYIDISDYMSSYLDGLVDAVVYYKEGLKDFFETGEL